MSKTRQPGRGNPVARHMETFSRPATHVDKKKERKRGMRKHRKSWQSTSSFFGKKKGAQRRPILYHAAQE